jgi:hypothetical protein
MQATRSSSKSSSKSSGKSSSKTRKKSGELKKSSDSNEHEFITPILSRVFGEKFTATKIKSFKNKFNVLLLKKRCVEFSTHTINGILEIHIDYLDNCKPPDMDVTSALGSGSHTMRILIDFAREIRKIEGYENTKLVVKIDASSIYIHKMKFPLDVLFILTRGESWYNSLGFREEEYTLNFGKASEYIDSIMEPFTKKIENTSCNFKKQNSSDPKKTNKECFKSIFTRLKELSNVEALSPEETKELKYYHTLIKKQEKLLTALFNNTKALNLYYNFE